MTENAVTRSIVGAPSRVHTALGPGKFESFYEAVPASELEKRGLQVARRQPMAEIALEDKEQMLTYLRLPHKPPGLVINFNAALIREGITRIVKGPEE